MTLRMARGASPRHRAYSSASPKLRWSPPQQVSPTIVSVPQGFYSGTFAADEDVIFHWPASVRFSEFICAGGRNVRIIGGASSKGAGGSAIQVVGCAGSVFLEGLAIDVTIGNIDAINACGNSSRFPDIYIQNCRLLNVKGSNAGTHADAFQAQGAIGSLLLDKVTISSNYQGISLFQNQFAMRSAYISRLNGSYIAGGDPSTSLMWNMDEDTSAPYAPVYLDEVYFAPRAGQNLSDCAWPQPSVMNDDGVAIGITTSDAWATATWPAITNCHGVVKSGAPAGGDWCASGVPGIAYSSPGYQ